jgi:uncharacterized protein (DUF362 family)
MDKHTVIIRHCDRYDPDLIAEIIGEGMDDLGVKPHGRAMVKPNVVIAHKELFANAFTRPEFLDGLLSATLARSDHIEELTVGERCGITIPTRYAFAMADYPRVLRKHHVRANYFDEGTHLRVDLHHPDAMREFLLMPEAIVHCDFLINAPKFKAHPWTKVTFSLKNYIGIQHDPQRLIDHDHMLHTKIADLQEVIQPGFIAIDGITAGESTMLTPTPFPLKLIIMGLNPVAVDSVCTRIIGLDPNEVDHIRITAGRGIGPIDLDQIELRGDVSLEEAQSRATGLNLTLEKIDQIFNGKSNITTYSGPPPDTYDYCWGGCPGSLFEAMQILRQFQPDAFQAIRPMHFAMGACSGPIDPPRNQRLLFVGDCAVWKGRISGEPVDIPFLYKQRHHINPYQASSGDVIVKMVDVLRNMIRYRNRQVIRVTGCPVSVAELVLYGSWLGGVVNPYFHPKIFFPFVYYWIASKLSRLWNNLVGRSLIFR